MEEYILGVAPAMVPPNRAMKWSGHGRLDIVLLLLTLFDRAYEDRGFLGKKASG